MWNIAVQGFFIDINFWVFRVIKSEILEILFASISSPYVCDGPENENGQAGLEGRIIFLHV